MDEGREEDEQERWRKREIRQKNLQEMKAQTVRQTMMLQFNKVAKEGTTKEITVLQKDLKTSII